MTYIIAEFGTSHQGKLERAKNLCLQAREMGADAAKFQLFVPREDLFCPLEGDELRWARWNESTMLFPEWKHLKDFCDRIEIDFMASVFQHTAVEWMKELKPRYWKVASRAAMTFPYDEAPGPFLVSMGMIEEEADRPGVAMIWMQCRSQYPTKLSDRARWSGVYDGLSDHSGTVFPGLDAMARGCRFLEVHVENEPPDDIVSISWSDLKLLCEARDAFAEMRSGS